VGLALANLLLAAYMTGLIWFVGVVHYPLFARVGRDAWAAYERAHRFRTTLVVGPPMLAQLPVGALLCLDPPPGAGTALPVASLACTLVALGSTALVFGPAHARLEARWSPRDHRLLVRGNWLRVAAWTLQAGLATALAAAAAG
jgi:hypothetical protein